MPLKTDSCTAQHLENAWRSVPALLLCQAFACATMCMDIPLAKQLRQAHSHVNIMALHAAWLHTRALLRAGYQVTFDYVPELKITAELLYDVAHGLRVRDGWYVSCLSFFTSL